MLHPYQKQESARESCQGYPSEPVASASKHPGSSTWLPGSRAVQSTQDRLRSPFASGGKNLQGVPAVRPSGSLRLHPILIQLNLVEMLINCAVHGRKPSESIPE